MRLSVCVNHGSTLDPKTTFTDEARGAKAAAEAGNSCGGIVEKQQVVVVGVLSCCRVVVLSCCRRRRICEGEAKVYIVPQVYIR